MLSVLVKQGTTLHLSGEGGKGSEEFWGDGDHILFGGGEGGITTTEP